MTERVDGASYCYFFYPGTVEVSAHLSAFFAASISAVPAM